MPVSPVNDVEPIISNTDGIISTNLHSGNWGGLQHDRWERTAYRGKHQMLCEIIKNGSTVAKAQRTVFIR